MTPPSGGSSRLPQTPPRHGTPTATTQLTAKNHPSIKAQSSLADRGSTLRQPLIHHYGKGRDRINSLCSPRSSIEYVENAMAVSFVEDAGWWDPKMEPFMAAWPLPLREEADRQATWRSDHA